MTPVWLSAGDAYWETHAGLEAGIGHALDAGTILASVGSGQILGAMLFNGYNPDAGVIEMHAAAVSPRWFSRRIINEAFNYAFREIGCQAVVMRTHPENSKVRRIAQFLGFRTYEIPRLRGRGTSEILMVLYDDVWARHKVNKGAENG